MNLDIKDKDDKYAAIEDYEISPDQDIITESNKVFKEGDRVRKESK